MAVGDDAEAEERLSAMMRTRRLALDGMMVIASLLRGGVETALNSREGSNRGVLI